MYSRLLHIFGAGSPWEWVVKMALSILASFLPLKELILTIIGLIVVDLALGYMVSRYRPMHKRNKRLSDTAQKLLTYNLVLISFFITEKHILPELPLMRLSSAVLAVTELVSISRNFYLLRGVNILAVIKAYLGGQRNIWKAVMENKKDKPE